MPSFDFNTEEFSEILGPIRAAIQSFIGSVGIVNLVIIVLMIIAMWRIFTKAGEKGWKCLIPIYNVYVECRIAGRKSYFWKLILLAVLSSVLAAAAAALVSVPLVSLLLAVGVIVVAVIMFVMVIKLYHSFSIRFGHGWGYTIGLLLLPTLFTLILAFGKSTYRK